MLMAGEDGEHYHENGSGGTARFLDGRDFTTSRQSQPRGRKWNRSFWGGYRCFRLLSCFSRCGHGDGFGGAGRWSGEEQCLRVLSWLALMLDGREDALAAYFLRAIRLHCDTLMAIQHGNLKSASHLHREANETWHFLASLQVYRSANVNTIETRRELDCFLRASSARIGCQQDGVAGARWVTWQAYLSCEAQVLVLPNFKGSQETESPQRSLVAK